jgi:hypothetical protein
MVSFFGISDNELLGCNSDEVYLLSFKGDNELEKLLVKRGVSKNTVYEILSYTEVSCRAIKYYIKKKSEEC